MGLLTDIEQAVSSAFDTDLADAVKSFTLQTGNTKFNVATGGLDKNSSLATGTWRGVFYNMERSSVSNSHQQPFDLSVIALTVEAPFTPNIGDLVIRDSAMLKIKEIEKDPANATYILNCVTASDG